MIISLPVSGVSLQGSHYPLLRFVLLQAIGTKTIAVSLGNAQEILLQDLVAFAPAVFFPLAFEGSTAFGAGFGPCSYFDFLGVHQPGCIYHLFDIQVGFIQASIHSTPEKPASFSESGLH